MSTDHTSFSDEERARLEISLPSAQELCRLGLATMIDIRQTFEIRMKGAIPETEHIPLFEVKRLLGQALSDDEQDILDAGQPKDIDVMSFFTTINQLHHGRDHLLLFICNSGRRSLTAASLLRSLGYPKALSVGGGFQAWKKQQAAAVSADSATATATATATANPTPADTAAAPAAPASPSAAADAQSKP